MTNTREKILRTLLSFPGSTIKDLAEEVDINGISIRHHLTSLEAEDLVTSSEERHGVGRPRLVYSLTNKGLEKFPTNYINLTKRIMTLLKEKLTEENLALLFSEIGSEIANSYVKNFEGKSMEHQMDMLNMVMKQEGFTVEIRKNKDSYILTTLSCPYIKLAAHFPEICHLDQQLISDYLSKPIDIETCILQGDNHCTFKILS